MLPGIGGLHASAAPLLATSNPDRVLLLVQLKGGNDGLNTVIPIADDRYYTQRPTLGIAGNTALGLTASAALHPALSNLHGHWQDNELAVVQSVGYPDMTKSHFKGIDYWMEGSDPGTGNYDSGWVGRTMLGLDPDYFTNPPAHPLALGVGASFSPLFETASGSTGVAFKDVSSFERVAETGQLWSLNGLQAGVGGSQQRFVREVGNRSFAFGTEIASVYGTASNTASYPNTNLSKSLATIARLIRGGLSTRVYHVSLGGFDTHANQLSDHANRLGQLDAALGAFYADLQNGGHDQRVLTLTFSEFGRRVYENGSAGTDHGAASVMFALGPGVTPDVYGPVPDLGENDVPVALDFRSLYSDALTGWMGMSQTDVSTLMGGTFPSVGIVQGGGLPVELTGFNAYVTAAGVELRWATLTETGADHFVIERSMRGSTSEFEAIGRLQATGSRQQGATYRFTDPASPGGRVSYRLRQVDRDGRFAFYGPITVEASAPLEFGLSAYPNPSRGNATIEVHIPATTTARVDLFTPTGQRVLELHDGPLSPGRHALRLTNRVSAGRYLARLITPEAQRTVTLVVQR
ncbi:MAG: DUF1501 domain-containing protein [Bacteroidota bacterium]